VYAPHLRVPALALAVGRTKGRFLDITPETNAGDPRRDRVKVPWDN